MNDRKVYEVVLTGRSTYVVSGEGLSEEEACLAAKADAAADRDFTVDSACVLRAVPEREFDSAVWNSDTYLDTDWVK